MGNVWFHGLPPVLEKWNVEYILYPGAGTRSRSSGGCDDFRVVLNHHTGGAGDGASNADYNINRHPTPPVANGVLDKLGVFHFYAMGASNHAGKGGPFLSSKGVIPEDALNRYSFGIEAINRGDNEDPWPLDQVLAYIRLNCALVEFGGLAFSDLIDHHIWAPLRKIDRAGPIQGNPDEYANLNTEPRYGKWDSAEWQNIVRNYYENLHPKETGPMDTYILPVPVRFDSRSFGKVRGGASVDVPRLTTEIPKDAKALAVNITTIDTKQDGFVTLWAEGSRPNFSPLNTTAGLVKNGFTVVPVNSQGGFKLYSLTDTHIVLDVIGYLK